MKTVMQELIEIVSKRRDFIEDEGYKEAMEDVLLIVLNLLKDEKEQIMEAFAAGYEVGYDDGKYDSQTDTDYYTQTFKSDE